jgi:hypothetical protein
VTSTMRMRASFGCHESCKTPSQGVPGSNAQANVMPAANSRNRAKIGPFSRRARGLSRQSDNAKGARAVRPDKMSKRCDRAVCAQRAVAGSSSSPSAASLR